MPRRTRSHGAAGAALLLLAATACSDAGPSSLSPDLPLDAPAERLRELASPGAPRAAADRIEALLAADSAGEPLSISLAPGHYWLRARAYTDPKCGNCEDPDHTVSATAGLVLSGRGVELVGAGDTPGDVVIHTGAGYGIVFDGCAGCGLHNLTVTDTRRDTVGEATSAAVIVRDGDVHVDHAVIRDNLGDSAVVANTISGVMGIAVREGGDLTLTDSRIVRNSWDGVAMYRDARGTLRNNLIDGVDKATGAKLGGGRGVGIGLTWNARATVEGNRVTRYWKGIGVFVDAEAEIRENVVEDVLTWGIVMWDADRGTPRAVIERNAVYETGACGVNIYDTGEAAPAPGDLRDNLVVKSGQNPRYDSGEPYCEQTAIARPAVPAGFAIEGNLLTDNREADGAPGRDDIPRAEFEQRAAALLEALRARPALAESAFLAGGE
ncbi:MAG: right-handed parallel beta-helix repeat-containing protein [Gemmatimonadales bacterium]